MTYAIALGMLLSLSGTAQDSTDELNYLRKEVKRLEGEFTVVRTERDELEAALAKRMEVCRALSEKTRMLEQDREVQALKIDFLRQHGEAVTESHEKERRQMQELYEALQHAHIQLSQAHEEAKQESPDVRLREEVRTLKEELKISERVKGSLEERFESLEKELIKLEDEQLAELIAEEEFAEAFVSEVFADIPDSFLRQELVAKESLRRIVATRIAGWSRRGETALIKLLWKRAKRLPEGAEFDETTLAFQLIGAPLIDVILPELSWASGTSDPRTLLRAVQLIQGVEEVPSHVMDRLRGLLSSIQKEHRGTENHPRQDLLEDLIFELELAIGDDS